jgi:hypothetical protein
MATIKFIEFTNPIEEGSAVEKLPIRISNYALTLLKEETGKSLTELDPTGFSSEYGIIFYHSLAQGHYFTQKELKYDREFIIRVIYDMVYMDFLKMIPEFFEEVTEKKKAPTKPKSGKK